MTSCLFMHRESADHIPNSGRNTIRSGTRTIPLSRHPASSTHFLVLFSVFSVKFLLSLFSVDPAIVRSLALKAIAAPVALELSRENGGIAAITAIGGMFAAILGTIRGPWVLKMARITDPAAVGLALGCGSHGVGTARAVELGEIQGAFASIGMSCSAIVSSILCPLILRHLP